MEFTPSEMAEIVAQSSSIYDRLDTSRFAPDGNYDDDLVNKKLRKWKHTISGSGDEIFHKRLAWDGLCEESIKPGLGPVRLLNIDEMPRWTATFNACIRAVSPEFFSSHQTWLAKIKTEKPYAFEDILFPFVAVARNLLRERVGDQIQRLSSPVQVDLERALLEKLVGISGQALQAEFYLKRMASSPLARFGVNLGGERDLIYRKFVKDMYDGEIILFFKKYPVLAQLLGTCIDLWLDVFAEFVGRLGTDWEAIQATFSPMAKIKKVTGLELSLSDPHNNNRTVIGVTFDSGTKIVYKPKSVGLDQVYSQILRWLMDQGFPLPFRLLDLLPRSGYGWVEFIEQVPCQREEEAIRYYQRAGSMLCLWYALMGTDCHHENLIAHGEHPIFIDLETLMCPHPKPMSNQSASSASKMLIDSVITTGMLPRWRVTNHGRSYDFSAFGYLSSGGEEVSSIKWEHANTDAMALKIMPITKQPQKNVPYLGQTILQPNEYLDDIVDGFRMMYLYLMEKREALLKTGLLDAMSKQKVRFVFRNTEMYGSLVRQAVHPRYLSDGVDHQIQLDVLSKALLLGEERAAVWPIIRAEYASLKQQDIPFFMAYPKQDSLQISADHWIPGYFVEPSYKQVVARLESFNESDLTRQIMLIRTSFQAHIAHKGSESEGGKLAFQLTLTEVEPATPKMMMQAADEIARLIRGQAIISGDGSANWVGMKHYLEANRYQLEPLGHDLYDGNTGIALFLAAMDKISERPTYRDFILNQALYSLRNLLRNPASATAVKRMAERSPIGGAIGSGSLAYALTKISQLLNEKELLEDAVLAGLLIAPELIAADRRLDLLLGAGGALLSLLAVFEATHDERMKDLALLCGEHLLVHRRMAKTGHYAWPTNAEGRLLTGFSHGAAGISYALLRLYEVTQDERFFIAAKDGIAYEQAVFSVEENNWPDWRRWDSPKYDTIRWCSGAPGIGLSRLVGLHIWDTEEIHKDISRAVDITCNADFHSTDHPCCGNLGRAEIMLEIANRSNDTRLLEDVYKRVGWILARKQFNGEFSVSPFFDDILQPSFFQGLAGIGYSLLRIANPDALPLILAWE